MRGILTAIPWSVAAIVAALAPPTTAHAEPVTEVTGNWGGSDQDGFPFRARIEPGVDGSRLMLWNGNDTVPPATDAPQLDVPGFAMSAYVTQQGLELDTSADGTTLQIVSVYADEEGEGREVISLAYLDFQFTVTGYLIIDVWYGEGEEARATQCEIDFIAGKVVQRGQTRDLPPMPFEALNASNWREGKAFDEGGCQRQ